ncbi:MAG: hypothetical protein HXY28_07515 [Hydrogenophilaceae bacterium]|jgi:tetratricopeptide (TPR) repeat protein|nr:hypothetical protein [Hydrogenophilaceae bacterium]
MNHALFAGAFAAALVGVSMRPPSPPDASGLRAMVLGARCGPEEGLARRAALGELLIGAAAYAQTLPGDMSAPPPLMPGLGDAHLAVTTSEPRAQAFFDQGLRMLHNFNHAEAIRAFKEAQRLDPQCAMCFWGEAFALGPNINAPMNPADNEPAFAAARAAEARAADASPLEQALIEAMQVRYLRTAPADRSGLDAAFADAMHAVAQRFPDSDVALIFAAEAAMDTQPWDYWQGGGREPKGRMGPAIAFIETVLARSPDNAGANHLYIHLAEASTNPWRAVRAADRLAPAAPAAGHLVHMPAHIYYRVGRFRDSMRANIAASAADEAYIRAANASPMYQYGYYPHNLHFVLTSAAMGGDARTALDYADRLDGALPIEMAAAVPIAQAVKAAPWFARAEFATPASVLAAPSPGGSVPLVTGAWRYARGMAHVRAGRLDDARAEAAAIQTLLNEGDFSLLIDNRVPAREIVDAYRLILLAKADMAARNYASAIAQLEAAIAIQHALPYMEPPYIYYPVRRTLGAAYMLSGQPERAEMEFLATLIESPNDAYAYWGLSEARRRQGDRVGANAARQMFNQAYMGRRAAVTAYSL